MSKKLTHCLEQKVRLMDELEQKLDMNVEEWSAHVYHWKQIMDKLSKMTITLSFRTKASERMFYEKTWIDTLSYYWYSRELALFYSLLHVEVTQREAYIYQKLQQYMNYRVQSFEQYTAFCAQQLTLDCQAFKAYVLDNDRQGKWAFFDAECPFLYNAYFGALQLILRHINGLLDQQAKQEKQTALIWNRSKQDFCLLVYALSYCNRVNREKGALLAWVQAFSQLFDLDVSKHFYQTLSEFKKRKDISNNFLAEMLQVIVDKYNE